MQAVKSQHQVRVETLTRLLGDVTEDEHGVLHHGLTWLYPQVKTWPTVRSVGGGGGGKPGTALPFNAEALDFIGGDYWVGDSSQDRCSDSELDDPTNYRTGFEPTVLGMEQSVRIQLGAGRAPKHPRPSADDILEPLPAVTAAIAWLLAAVDAIAANDFLYAFVREECARLASRATSMMLGSRFSAGRSQCPHCYQTDSVISDEDRAVCVSPICRRADGSRHCWRWALERPEQLPDDGQPWVAQWVDVDEPDLRGRGQVTDEKLSRWAETG